MDTAEPMEVAGMLPGVTVPSGFTLEVTASEVMFFKLPFLSRRICPPTAKSPFTFKLPPIVASASVVKLPAVNDPDNEASPVSITRNLVSPLNLASKMLRKAFTSVLPVRSSCRGVSAAVTFTVPATSPPELERYCPTFGSYCPRWTKARIFPAAPLV